MSQLILPKEKELLVPDPAWEPLYYTRALSKINRGEDITDFALSAMKASKGAKGGQPLALVNWQQFAVNSILEEDETGSLRYKRFLLGMPRKNGKSLIGTAIAMERLFYGHEGTQIFSAAKDRDQAKIVFGEAKKQIAKSPMLQEVLKPYRDVIVNRKTGAFYKAASSDAMSFQGYGPELIVCDEIHGWVSGQAEEFWAAANEGSGDLLESLVLAISTAGAKLDSLLGELHQHGIKIINGEIDDPSFGMCWWGAPEDADIFSEDTWRKSNPNLAEGLLTMSSFKDSLTLAASTGDLNSFKRYRLNQWVRVDGKESFLTPFHWEQSQVKGKIAKGSKICVGFDGSISDDSSGFIGIDMETGMLEILAYWERDYSNPDWTVPRDEIMEAQVRIFKEYDVQKMYCDPSFFQTDVERWAKIHRGKVERIPQSNSRMVPYTTQLKIDLLSGHTTHNEDPLLKKHFLNAVKDDAGKISKESRMSKNKIDFAVCSVLANAARNKILRRGVRGRAITL